MCQIKSACRLIKKINHIEIIVYMNIKTSDNIFYIILMFVGVGIYALCMYLSFAFMRVAKLCVDTGGIVSIGAITGIIPFFLPLFLMFYSEKEYLNKRPRLKIWMYILCALLVFGFMLYCIFIDRDLILGREISLDLFLALYLLVLPIVYAVRIKKYDL